MLATVLSELNRRKKRARYIRFISSYSVLSNVLGIQDLKRQVKKPIKL